MAPPKQEIIPPEPDASPDMPAPEAPKDGDAAPTAPTPQRRRCKPPKAPDFVPASGKPAKAPDFVPGPVTEDDSTDSGNLRDLFDRIVAIIPEELAADLSAELWEWMDLPFPSGRLVDGAAETIAHTFEAALVSRYPHRNLHTGVMGYAEAPEDEPAPDREQHSERKPESDSKQADSKKNDPEESDAEAAA